METDTKPRQDSGLLILRIASAFLHRDWTTVFVELVLIVLGILVALEVDRWNTKRIEKDQEAFYVAWIADSLDGTIDRGKRAIKHGESSIESATWVHDRLQDCDLADDEAALFAERLLSIGPWDYAYFNDAAISELRSTGSTESIQSTQLRQDLANLEHHVRFYRTSIRNIEAMMRDNMAEMSLLYDVRYSSSGPEMISTHKSLCESPQLARRIAFHIRGHSLFMRFSTGHVEYLARLRESLPVSD